MLIPKLPEAPPTRSYKNAQQQDGRVVATPDPQEQVEHASTKTVDTPAAAAHPPGLSLEERYCIIV